MSVFGDFQRVWLQRFPNSALPAAWEEDVRANLAKHKQKVSLLQEELEKEEFYVEYLERLLSDVEQHKKTSDDTNKTGSVQLHESNDKVTISDNISKVNNTFFSRKQTFNKRMLQENETNINTVTAANTEIDSQRSINQCVSELSVSIDSVRRSNSVKNPVSADNKSRRNTDPSNFVTVIEVNGLKNRHTETDFLNARRKVPPK